MKTKPQAYQDKQQDNATEAAIALVEANNSPDPFKEAYEDALDLLVKLPEEVTSDTAFPHLDKYDFTDRRVVGPLMRQLQKDGKIRMTTKYRPSGRVGNHGCPRRIYVNLTSFKLCLTP